MLKYINIQYYIPGHKMLSQCFRENLQFNLKTRTLDIWLVGLILNFKFNFNKI